MMVKPSVPFAVNSSSIPIGIGDDITNQCLQLSHFPSCKELYDDDINKVESFK